MSTIMGQTYIFLFYHMVCGKDNNTKLTSFLPKLLKDKEAYAKMSKACNPYGDGHACERIADILEDKVY